MEKFLYESRPYLFLSLAIYLFVNQPKSHLLVGSCLLLVLASIIAIHARMTYRKILRQIPQAE